MGFRLSCCDPTPACTRVVMRSVLGSMDGKGQLVSAGEFRGVEGISVGRELFGNTRVLHVLREFRDGGGRDRGRASVRVFNPLW